LVRSAIISRSCWATAARMCRVSFGEVDILGKLYVTGYDAIKDASGKVIGIWYVGYEK
jgi:hypothetical protein